LDLFECVPAHINARLSICVCVCVCCFFMFAPTYLAGGRLTDAGAADVAHQHLLHLLRLEACRDERGRDGGEEGICRVRDSLIRCRWGVRMHAYVRYGLHLTCDDLREYRPSTEMSRPTRQKKSPSQRRPREPCCPNNGTLTGAVDGLLDGRGPQLRGGEGGQPALELAYGRARERDDHGVLM
jgi:hypothetical protein